VNKEKLKDSFERHVIHGNGCWLWSGVIKNSGYGMFKSGRIYANTAHRAAYEFYVGPIPGPLMVLHSCDNRLCVRPSHLFLGTCQDNSDDKVKKGRQAKGEKIGISKLNRYSVFNIRRISGTMPIERIARAYDVSKSTIQRVLSRKTWRHV